MSSFAGRIARSMPAATSSHCSKAGASAISPCWRGSKNSDFHYVEVGGKLLTDFKGSSAEREAFTKDAALGELTRHFGVEATSKIEVVHVTNWWDDPLSRGSWSVTPPGKALAREALQLPVGGKIFFAGEATSPTQWGTAGGAWLEGERAARAILRS